MGLNFPASPAINDLYPVPAVPGVPQYKWDGTVWLANAGGGGAAGGDFVPIAGGVMTGELINKIGLGVIAAGQSGAYLSILKPPAAAGANTVEGGVGEQTDWSDYQARWQIMLGDTKDAAGNTGNNFAVFRFDNTGLPLGKPLAIDRATGQVLLANDPTQPLSVATKQYVDTKVAAVPVAPAAATVAEYRSNSAPTKMLTPGTAWGAMTSVDLSGTEVAGVLTIDFNSGFDFFWYISAAGRTLANPTGLKTGQRGTIVLSNTGAGTITTWGSKWKFPGGVKPTLTPNAVDLLSYFVADPAANIYCTVGTDFK